MQSVKANQPDFTMLMDLSGTILEATVNTRVLEGTATEGNTMDTTAQWIGTQWENTVEESDKARRLIKNVKQQHVYGFSQINQRLPGGKTVLVEYTAICTGEKRDRIVIIGKNLTAVVNMQNKLISTQKNMEKEFWKLRELETRYRTLVNTTAEAVMILREPDLRVVDGNDQALRLSGLSVGEQLGDQHFSVQNQSKFRRMLDDAKANGRSPISILRFAHSREGWMVRASAYEGNSGLQFMLQFSKPEEVTTSKNVKSITGVKTSDIINSLPDGLATINAQDIITHTNTAFARLVQSETKEELLGKSMAGWMSQSDNSLDNDSDNDPDNAIRVLRKLIDERGTITDFSSTLNQRGTQHEAKVNVLLSACKLHEGPSGSIIMLFRKSDRQENS